MTVGATRSSTPAEQLADRAYLALRDRIVDLRLPPGSTLRDDELMREMGIGRTPLREAVKRLALEHLVEVRPRRGTQVTDVRAEDVTRFAEVRAELEAHAARLAAARMEDALRAEAQELLAELAQAPRDDADALLALDARIHRFTWRASRNTYLASSLESYFVLSLRVWHLALDRLPALPGAVHEHAALLDALVAGDGERAASLMREHVHGFERKVVETIGA